MTRTPSLYKISEEMAALEALLDEHDGAVDDEDAAVVAKWLDEQAGALTDKMHRCIAWLREQEALRDAASDEAKRLDELAIQRERRVQGLRKAIVEVLDAHDIKRVDTPLGTVSVAHNGGRAPLVVDDYAAIPDSYRHLEPVLDRARLRADLEAGIAVPGARLGMRGKHVVIK